MAKTTSTTPDSALNPVQPEVVRQYRLVNQMPQKLVINVVAAGTQESVELGIKEKSRLFSSRDLGPHVETLRKARHLIIEAA